MTIISFFSVIKRKVIAVKTCHAPSPFIEKSVMPFNRHIDFFPATQHWKYRTLIWKGCSLLRKQSNKVGQQVYQTTSYCCNIITWRYTKWGTCMVYLVCIRICVYFNPCNLRPGFSSTEPMVFYIFLITAAASKQIIVCITFASATRNVT